MNKLIAFFLGQATLPIPWKAIAIVSLLILFTALRKEKKEEEKEEKKEGDKKE